MLPGRNMRACYLLQSLLARKARFPLARANEQKTPLCDERQTRKFLCATRRRSEGSNLDRIYIILDSSCGLTKIQEDRTELIF